MSRAQIDACAERITDDEQRLQFLALMAASAALFGQAVLAGGAESNLSMCHGSVRVGAAVGVVQRGRRGRLGARVPCRGIRVVVAAWRCLVLAAWQRWRWRWWLAGQVQRHDVPAVGGAHDLSG